MHRSPLNAIENKVIRYVNLFGKVRNWPAYLFRKMTGFGESFEFKLRDFQDLRIPANMIGSFRECYLERMYFRYLPDAHLASAQEPVVIDVGANVGFFAISVFSEYPRAVVHSIEPHPHSFVELEKKRSLLEEYAFHPHRLAISGENGTLSLHTSAVDAHTTRTSIIPEGSATSAFEVDCVRLDRFLEQNGIDHVDLLKLDCEGSEFGILKGLSQATCQKIAAIAMETHQAAGSIDDLTRFLSEMGYRIKRRDNRSTGYLWAWRVN